MLVLIVFSYAFLALNAAFPWSKLHAILSAVAGSEAACGTIAHKKGHWGSLSSFKPELHEGWPVIAGVAGATPLHLIQPVESLLPGCEWKRWDQWWARLSVLYIYMYIYTHKTCQDSVFALDLVCNTGNTEMLRSERLRCYFSPMPSAFGPSFGPCGMLERAPHRRLLCRSCSARAVQRWHHAPGDPRLKALPLVFQTKNELPYPEKVSLLPFHTPQSDK